ncbi:sigma-54-dependent transcriptional regulator [Undibacterium sp. SXout20W]|uniref:sigma-54-dependent transcriptional regulator n=1 Tax=Undibacterium sp. SXout20W TaxID=3413051 RepID=UPI003BEFC2D1
MTQSAVTPCPRILVVDDEAHLRELLEITLIKMGLDVDSAESIAQARSYLTKKSYSLVLTDMRLPDGSGMDLVAEVNSNYKSIPIAVITAFGSANNAVVALKAGAFDYVSKPVALDQLRKLVRSALEMNEVAIKGVPVAEETAQAASASFLIGRSERMQAVRAQIARLARSMAPVIITGESGSGKELAAREIHSRSARAKQPFIAVNCGAIPETLMEAEFFGYRKGAFTGAVDDREGFFQAANGGTLMLDEVADLPLAMQVKLLRAIQERSIRKVGATTEELVDVRIVSATHQNLSQCVAEGRFRQDLYYRLNVIELRLPPLRERLEDIEDLSTAILSKLNCKDIAISPDALHALATYSFPGNVRELENILERAVAFADDFCIEVDDLVLHGSQKLPERPPQNEAVVDSGKSINLRAKIGEEGFFCPPFPCSLPEFLDSIEAEMIRRALQQTGNNRTQAAELLGVSFRQLRYQIQKLKIQE